MSKSIICLIIFLISCKSLGQIDTLEIQQLMDKAYDIEISNPAEAIKQYRKTFDLSQAIEYKIGAYKSLLYSGIVYSNIGNYDLAKQFYQKTVDYCKKSKILIGEGKAYANMANMHQFKGDYTNAIKNYISSIKIFEKLKDSAIISQNYKNLSAIYNQYQNQNLEFYYLKKAEQFVNEENYIDKGLIYNDFALANLRYNRMSEALNYLNKAENMYEKSKNEELHFYVVRNFGEYYRIFKQYEKAIPFYEKALDLADNAVDVIRKCDLLYIISEVYLQTGNYLKAEELAMKSLVLSRQINAKEMEYKALRKLSIIYNKRNNPQKAYDFLEKSFVIKDSIFSDKLLEESTMLQAKFETEKKDKSIAEQQIKIKEQEINLIKNQKQKQLYLIGFAILGMMFFGIWYFFRQRQKLKNKEIETLKKSQKIAKLEALIDGEEKERRRIAQELHDGLNGDLSAIKYRLSTLEESGLSAIDSENLTKVINMIDESCAQVRSISHNLMPSSILDYGLIETVNQYCVKINNTDNFRINFQTFGNYIALSKKNETVIYRIIQELITNILKHSKATEAMIQFNYREEELFITVEDNGIGFDKNAASGGIGHQNIQTRIDFLNAHLDVDSSAAGTSYTISIDLNNVK